MDVTHADDSDLNESVSWFEAALAAQEPQLDEPRLERILMVLDGSNQDGTVEGLSTWLARRDDATVVPMDAYAGPLDETRELHLADRAAALIDAGVSVRPLEQRPDSAEDSPPHEQILERCATDRCHLIVICAPYGDEFTVLGSESVGSTLDVLMSRATVPLLVVREPKSDPQRCLQSVLLPLMSESRELIDAAGWALRIVHGDGSVRMLAVVDQQSIESAADILRDHDEVDDRLLSGLQRPAVAGLIAAMHRRAQDLGSGSRVSVRSGEVVAETAALANADEGLVVTTCPRDAASVAFQRVQGLLRASRNPVLVV